MGLLGSHTNSTDLNLWSVSLQKSNSWFWIHQWNLLGSPDKSFHLFFLTNGNNSSRWMQSVCPYACVCWKRWSCVRRKTKKVIYFLRWMREGSDKCLHGCSGIRAHRYTNRELWKLNRCWSHFLPPSPQLHTYSLEKEVILRSIKTLRHPKSSQREEWLAGNEW